MNLNQYVIYRMLSLEMMMMKRRRKKLRKGSERGRQKVTRCSDGEEDAV